MTNTEVTPEDEEKSVQPIRHERVTLRMVYAYGGTLALTGTTLIWKRSRWPSLGAGAVGSRATPKVEEIDIRKSDVCLGPHRPIPWILFILFPFTIVLELLSGGFRRTIKVATRFPTSDGFLYFSVKDAEAWLRDIAIVKGESPTH